MSSVLEVEIGKRRFELHGWPAVVAFVAMVYWIVWAPVALLVWLMR